MHIKRRCKSVWKSFQHINSNVLRSKSKLRQICTVLLNYQCFCSFWTMEVKLREKNSSNLKVHVKCKTCSTHLVLMSALRFKNTILWKAYANEQEKCRGLQDLISFCSSFPRNKDHDWALWWWHWIHFPCIILYVSYLNAIHLCGTVSDWQRIWAKTFKSTFQN